MYGQETLPNIMIHSGGVLCVPLIKSLARYKSGVPRGRLKRFRKGYSLLQVDSTISGMLSCKAYLPFFKSIREVQEYPGRISTCILDAWGVSRNGENVCWCSEVFGTLPGFGNEPEGNSRTKGKTKSDLVYIGVA